MSVIADWLARAEEQLDRWGKPGWIGAMVLGFVLIWPIGLAILAYMIWSGRMTCQNRKRSLWGRKSRTQTTNSAFEEYRAETLRRLEEDEGAFQGFLERLRKAKDRAEFDQFRAERANGGLGGQPDGEPSAA
ncbi:MAG: DUF2852 domain-containing protein [Pseudomonadota bacterium]